MSWVQHGRAWVPCLFKGSFAGRAGCNSEKSVQAAEENYSRAATPWKLLHCNQIKKELDLGEPANVRKGQGRHLCQLNLAQLIPPDGKS